MTEQHPITPPPELVQQWLLDAQLGEFYGELSDSQCYTAIQAARWAADQELEACCEWLQDPDLNVDTYKLRAARRPRSLSPKEEALQVLEALIESRRIVDPEYQALRHALEQLND